MFGFIHVKARYSSFEQSTIFDHRPLPNEKVKAYAFDASEECLILLTKIINRNAKKQEVLSIFDLADEDRLLYRGQVFVPEFLCRFKSGVLTVLKGHIYFRNRIIKIRYDLLRRQKGEEYSSEDILDYFEDILELGASGDEGISPAMPFVSFSSEKMAYLS